MNVVGLVICRSWEMTYAWSKSRSIQLLLPPRLTNPNKADIALVVERVAKNDQDYFYRGNTIFPLDWAYNAARQIAKPDKEWLKP